VSPKRTKPDPATVLRDGEALDRAIVAAQRRVVETHRKLGLPLVIWRDGKVVKVSASRVRLPKLPQVPATKRGKS
jgi:hypothetical protein